jgi:hypothetical protein
MDGPYLEWHVLTVGLLEKAELYASLSVSSIYKQLVLSFRATAGSHTNDHSHAS